MRTLRKSYEDELGAEYQLVIEYSHGRDRTVRDVWIAEAFGEDGPLAASELVHLENLIGRDTLVDWAQTQLNEGSH